MFLPHPAGPSTRRLFASGESEFSVFIISVSTIMFWTPSLTIMGICLEGSSGSAMMTSILSLPMTRYFGTLFAALSSPGSPHSSSASPIRRNSRSISFTPSLPSGMVIFLVSYLIMPSSAGACPSAPPAGSAGITVAVSSRLLTSAEIEKSPMAAAAAIYANTFISCALRRMGYNLLPSHPALHRSQSRRD